MNGPRLGWSYGILAALCASLLAVAGLAAPALLERFSEAASLRSAAEKVEEKVRDREQQMRKIESETASFDRTRAEAEARIQELETTERGLYVSALDSREQHLYAASTRSLEALLERFPETTLAVPARARIQENQALAQEWEKGLRERRKSRLKRDEESRARWNRPVIPFTGLVDRAAVQAERGARGEVYVWVWIALPQNTRVWVSLLDEKTGRTIGDGWAVLRDGAGRSTPFGPTEPPLAAGSYGVKIEASFSSPANQAVDAIERAGRNGENLSGQIVLQVLMGKGREKVVRYQASVAVPETDLRMEIVAKRSGGQAAGVSISGTAGLGDGAVVRLGCFGADGARLSGATEPAVVVQNGAFLGEVGLSRQPEAGDFCEAGFSPADESEPSSIVRTYGRKGQKLSATQVEPDPATGTAVLIASARIQ